MLFDLRRLLLLLQQGLSLMVVATALSSHSGGPDTCRESVTAAGVRHFDVRIPLLPVPEASVTTYICQAIQVPLALDRDYHAVAFEPLIDNRDVMHHMILFSCDGSSTAAELTSPHACSRADNACRTWMAQWSLGVPGIMCPPRNAGVRFGASVGRYLLLQIHWNNGQLRHNLTDQSGFRVFYTTDLRPYDLGHVQVGQQEIVIPAGVNRHAQSGGCSSQCTDLLLQEPIYISQAHLHMHYLGSGGWLDVVRKDGTVTQVFQDDSYDYNHPPVHRLTSPVVVRPGDYMRVTCLFSSKEGLQKRNRTVFFGEGSDGEMCYVFLEYYPQLKGFDQCLELGDNDVNCPSPSNKRLHMCTSTFLSLATSQLLVDVTAACNTTGDNLCHGGCKTSLNTLRSHECLQAALGGYVERELLSRLSLWPEVVKLEETFIRRCGASSVM